MNVKACFSLVTMKVSFPPRIFLWILCPALMLTACARTPQNPLGLASFSENSVSVLVSLERDANGSDFLVATFTPPDGYHLYSKDVPARGVNGQGRPTRLELTSKSHVQALGYLTESAGPLALGNGPEGLLVYPAGPVTLSLPVELPAGHEWVNDEVRISFMACTNNQCTPPVEKLLGIRLPGADLFNNP